MPKPIACLLILFGLSASVQSQVVVEGRIRCDSIPLPYALVSVPGTSIAVQCNEQGFFRLELPAETSELEARLMGYRSQKKNLLTTGKSPLTLNFDLRRNDMDLKEVVISGTMKEVTRLQSVVPVEVYSRTFLERNPSASLIDALENVNGCRPQTNCNVCNTGEIRINGMAGPYTMVLIDGMPMVQSLSSVYGLSGIPSSLIERIEIVKGPASALYGSEAVGGLINVITKKAQDAPRIASDVMLSSWRELNADLSIKLSASKFADVLTAVNHFNYSTPHDINSDGFTDMSLLKRTSLFQKWNLLRKDQKEFSIAGRILDENRWGGDLRWNKGFRGGDSIYGESILTRRYELLARYALPVSEDMVASLAFADHNQNAVYGTNALLARQKNIFAQVTWCKKIGKHDLLGGIGTRYQFYSDNAPVRTLGSEQGMGKNNQVDVLPGLFLQNEFSLNKKQLLLAALRYDYHSRHGSIFTPRLGYKLAIHERSSLRINSGTGFRVVNLFTEDHASLSGARTLVIRETLKPERSYNLNANFIRQFYFGQGSALQLDASVFYTYFTNRILPDYLSNDNQIIYENLSGFAVSSGFTLNADYNLNNLLRCNAGITLMENTITHHSHTTQQILAERFSGTWSIGYTFRKPAISIDYTGNVYSPMMMPLAGDYDPRPKQSPWWSVQNIQIRWSIHDRIEIYTGIKNLFNQTPFRHLPFLIARSHDPFDKQVLTGSQGEVLRTEENPYGLTFDPTYAFAPNQGIRAFAGIRFRVN